MKTVIFKKCNTNPCFVASQQPNNILQFSRTDSKQPTILNEEAKVLNTDQPTITEQKEELTINDIEIVQEKKEQCEQQAMPEEQVQQETYEGIYGNSIVSVDIVQLDNTIQHIINPNNNKQGSQATKTMNSPKNSGLNKSRRSTQNSPTSQPPQRFSPASIPAPHNLKKENTEMTARSIINNTNEKSVPKKKSFNKQLDEVIKTQTNNTNKSASTNQNKVIIQNQNKSNNNLQSGLKIVGNKVDFQQSQTKQLNVNSKTSNQNQEQLKLFHLQHTEYIYLLIKNERLQRISASKQILFNSIKYLEQKINFFKQLLNDHKAKQVIQPLNSYLNNKCEQIAQSFVQLPNDYIKDKLQNYCDLNNLTNSQILTNLRFGNIDQLLELTEEIVNEFQNIQKCNNNENDIEGNLISEEKNEELYQIQSISEQIQNLQYELCSLLKK